MDTCLLEYDEDCESSECLVADEDRKDDLDPETESPTRVPEDDLEKSWRAVDDDLETSAFRVPDEDLSEDLASVCLFPIELDLFPTSVCLFPTELDLDDSEDCLDADIDLTEDFVPVRDSECLQEKLLGKNDDNESWFWIGWLRQTR